MSEFKQSQMIAVKDMAEVVKKEAYKFMAYATLADAEAGRPMIELIQCPCGSKIRPKGFWHHQKTAIHTRYVISRSTPILTKIRPNKDFRDESDACMAGRYKVKTITLAHYDIMEYRNALMTRVSKDIANRILFLAGIFDPFTKIPREIYAINYRRVMINLALNQDVSLPETDMWCFLHNTNREPIYECDAEFHEVAREDIATRCPGCAHHIGANRLKDLLHDDLMRYNFVRRNKAYRMRGALVELQRNDYRTEVATRRPQMYDRSTFA